MNVLPRLSFDSKSGRKFSSLAKTFVNSTLEYPIEIPINSFFIVEVKVVFESSEIPFKKTLSAVHSLFNLSKIKDDDRRSIAKILKNFAENDFLHVHCCLWPAVTLYLVR